MLDRSRSVVLAWAALLTALFAVLAVLVTQWKRYPLAGIDAWGEDAENWADGHTSLVYLLRGVEHTFGTIGMTIITVVIAGALLYNKQRRAAIYTVLVMLSTSLITSGLKVWLSRDRPDWQDRHTCSPASRSRRATPRRSPRWPSSWSC